MIIDREKIQDAKEALGDRNAFIMAELLDLQEFDEKNMKAVCCFHDEDTPSLIYNPKNYTFHCFGCQKTVDIIDVYMQVLHLTYIEAVQKLFEEAGIRYSFGEAGVRTQRQYHYPHEESKDNDMKQVYEYLESRHISKETADYADVRSDGKGNMVFNYYDTNDVLTMVKYRPAKKVTKRSKQPKCWCQPGADTTHLLFNMNRINVDEPLILNEGECMSEKAEVMTPEGWIKLGEYAGQQVLQIHPDLTASFVTPTAYIKKEYDGDMVDVSIGGNYFTSTTANHNLVFQNKNKELFKRKAIEKISASYYIPTTIHYGCDKCSWTNDEIALLLAISADSSIRVKKTSASDVDFHLVKERKITRLTNLLDRLGIKYVLQPERKNPQRCHIIFSPPEKFLNKTLPWWFVTDTSLEQKRFIIEEMVEWDGNRVNGRNQYEYASTIKQNVDIIQAVASTSGYMSTIMHRTKENKVTGKHYEWYKISILLNKHYVGTQSFEKYKVIHHEKQMVYCVTVPTGMILVRQKGCISVTGNCDCLAAIESGFHNAVSVPLGAGNFQWIEHNWDWLNQFSSIIICADNDEAGIKLQKEAVYRLGSWRTKIVNIPYTVKSKTGKQVAVKDLNEVLYHCGKDAVIDLISNASDTPIPSLIDFSDIKEQDLLDMDGIETGIAAVDKAIVKFFYGNVNIITGTPGAGKTSFLCQLIAQAIDAEKPVWLFSRELPEWMTKNWIEYVIAGRRNLTTTETPSHTLQYRVTSKAQKDISDYYRSLLKVYRNDFSNTAEAIETSMVDSARKYGSKLFILDNLMMINFGEDNRDLFDNQTKFMNWLIDFALKYNVVVVLVCHPRKLQKDDEGLVSLDDIKGSSNLGALTQRAFTLKRVSEKEKEGTKKFDGSGWMKKPIKHDVLLTIIKDRMTGKLGYEIGLYYDKPSQRFFTNPKEYDYQYGWDKTKYTDELLYPVVDKEDEVFGKTN